MISTIATAPDPIDVRVGRRIKLIRKSLGISQAELAGALDVTFQQIQKYERGANRVSASALVRIAERLGTSVSDLVGERAEAKVNQELIDELATPGGVELLQAFAAIEHPGHRSALLQFARALGAHDSGVD